MKTEILSEAEQDGRCQRDDQYDRTNLGHQLEYLRFSFLDALVCFCVPEGTGMSNLMPTTTELLLSAWNLILHPSQQRYSLRVNDFISGALWV